MRASRCSSPSVRSRRAYALVVTLIMVALLAVISVGVFSSASLERATAKSYDNRYQAELAAQSGLEIFKETLVATPFPSPAPAPLPSSVTSSDTFLVVRADSGSAAYYYLAQSTKGSSPAITYYPLFSSSTDPSVPAVQTQTISLTAQDAPNPQNPTKPLAPLVPAPSAPANSVATDSTSAWNTAKTQRLPTLYSWAQPSPSPSGPSVKWVEMRDPQDAATAPAHNLPYSRYAYWAEDLDGYLDASQVGGQARSNGTNPQEIAMFTIFAPTQQTDPGTTAASTLINNRPLLFTVPTVQQVAATTPDVAGPNLAVRLGMDNNPGEQNLVPLGYGYPRDDQNKTGEGYPKNNLNSYFPLGNGNAVGQVPLGSSLPAFKNRSTGNGSMSYISNLVANIVDYAAPQNAPTDFNPPGNPHNPANSYRGVAPSPFVVSLYDLNNWVFTRKTGNRYHVVVEVKTYVQLWNPHNVPVTGVLILTVHYQNSDQVRFSDPATGVNKTFTLSSPPDATITFTNNPSGPNQYAPMQPNSYLVVTLLGSN